jgi:fructoselysine 6-kinase
MRLACVGDNVVDCYPHAGVVYPGGNAVNVAVSARRSGCESAYLGAVGDDAAGRLLINALTQEAVRTERLRIVPGHTAFAVVELTNGERVFVDSDIGVSEISLDEDDLAYLAEFDLVHTGDCSLLEDQLPRIRAAAPISFDFSTRSAAYCAPLLPLVEIATFSLGGRTDGQIERVLRDAAARGPRLVFATLGADGSVMLADGRLYRASAPTAAEVVDTLGAGDAFIGRALAGVLAEEAHDETLEAATKAAMATVGTLGAFGYPAALELPVERTGRRLP